MIHISVACLFPIFYLFLLGIHCAFNIYSYNNQFSIAVTMTVHSTILPLCLFLVGVASQGSTEESQPTEIPNVNYHIIKVAGPSAANQFYPNITKASKGDVVEVSKEIP